MSTCKCTMNHYKSPFGLYLYSECPKCHSCEYAPTKVMVF